MKRKITLVLCFLTHVLLSQNGTGTWNVVNFNVKIDKKWSAFAESQLRSLSVFDNFHYYEYKAGGSYALRDNFVVNAGVGSYNTFAEGGNFSLPMQNRELRTWQQFSVKTPIDRVVFENRFRYEQRFTSNGYRNRYRFRVGATVPLNAKKVAPRTLSAIAWNELFFTNREPYFERNRLFVGLGYEFTDFSIQTGYIKQFDYKINDETGRTFVNFAILYHIDLSKNKQFEPTNID